MTKSAFEDVIVRSKLAEPGQVQPGLARLVRRKFPKSNGFGQMLSIDSLSLQYISFAATQPQRLKSSPWDLPVFQLQDDINHGQQCND